MSNSKPHAEEVSVVSITLDDAFQHYLDTVAQPRLGFSVEHVGVVRQVWGLIVARFGPTFSSPVAMPTGDGALQLSWTRNQRHVSVDVYRDRWDWFFRDRSTGECDEGEVASFDALPEDLVGRLLLLDRDGRDKVEKDRREE